ncbi:hypothetical protein DFQ27_000106 [Actinomortierella ambigua]|uniref:Uncharacterized protein n=1 Tax=Actinomortierella ambigua TaxID=1343610 RepID=A0A9P6UD31_9FUNG|nr:hypothetical protein DFQ26_003542 [Actinomortierella ambigua]KAG0270187.1 hypothetical protein DFQ27_000106 [Actinomortierella ambigua]
MPIFVILFTFSLYLEHRPCMYCIMTTVLLFTTTCYWGSDRCWFDHNSLHIFEIIRQKDGTPFSTFGLAMPSFLSPMDDALEGLMRVLGGGIPLAHVIRSTASSASSAAVKAASSVVEAVAGGAAS